MMRYLRISNVREIQTEDEQDIHLVMKRDQKRIIKGEQDIRLEMKRDQRRIIEEHKIIKRD